MQAWGYLDYKSSVRNDVDFGVSRRGYSPAQSIGFAHSELALRLEEFPEEAPLALVALAMRAISENILHTYDPEDLFVLELRGAVMPERVGSVLHMLPSDQVEEFKRDIENVKSALERM